MVDDRLDLWQSIDQSNLYKDDRNNILLFWHGGTDFRPIGRGEEQLDFLFSPKDELIERLKK